MTDIKIEVRGDDDLKRKLIEQAIVRGELLQAADKTAVVMDARLRSYPPARPSSTYRRTNTLGRRWTADVQSFAGGVRTIHKNPTEYAPWVMDHELQAWMHVGRWATTKQILEEQTQKIVGFFETALRNIKKRLGF